MAETTVINRLVEDSLKSEYFQTLYLKVSTGSTQRTFHPNTEQNGLLNSKELNHLLRFADILSNSEQPEARNKAYEIVALLNPVFSNNPAYKTVAKAVFAKLGNFPAINYLVNKNNNDAELPFERSLEKDVKSISQLVPGTEDQVFTDSQYQLFERLRKSKFFSFSGPTSMGKSFIIKAFIKIALGNNPPENIVIVVPTRALINQFSLDLKKEMREELEEAHYKIITNSNVSEIADETPYNYIFVLTPERLISYLAQKDNPGLGYIFVDEAHKIAADTDVRSVTSYVAIERTLRKYPNINLYFASPNVSNPEVFLELFQKQGTNAFRTSESPVSQNLYFIDLIQPKVVRYIDNQPIESDTELLNQFPESTTLIEHLGSDAINIIYCNSRALTITKSLEFHEKRSAAANQQDLDPSVKKAIKQIKTFIHKDYYLATFLSAGIAYHYGRMPQIIRNIVEDLYRKEKIKFMFCTSTLLEGVNLPAKNIFILSNKKSKSNFTPIDFWNLAGRAGRLNQELSGNIFCIRDNEREWKKTDVLEKKAEIRLKPTVQSKTDTETNLKKIEDVLQNTEIQGTQTEKEILKYISNIICIETMQIEDEQPSPIIQKLIDRNQETILKLAEEKTKSVSIPTDILNANQSIDLAVQNTVFTSILKAHKEQKQVKLPPQVTYQNCLGVLQLFNRLYQWQTQEKEIKSEGSLKYYALLMNQWINGHSLSQMISGAIKWHVDNNLDFYINFRNVGKFDPSDKRHINTLINDIIENIEQILRFVFEKYFNHYHQILIQLLGEDNAGTNWALYLEYGTQDRIVIALQNLGLSRHSATYINMNHRSCLMVQDGKLNSINTARLFQEINPETIEFEEIIAVLS